MSRPRTPGSVPKRVLGGLLVGMAVVVGGCDLMTAQTSPRASRPISTPEPPPETAPVASDEAPTLRPEPSGDALDLVDAANRLADLDSYRVAVTTKGLVPATTETGAVSMTSTLVQGESPAAEFAMTGVAGIPGGRLEAVVIGDEAWLREGGGPWRESPGGAADFDAAFTALSPIGLVAGFEGLSPALAEIGEELKNGQPAVHYRSEDGDRVAMEAGLTRGTSDVWLAVDDGHLVAVAVEGTWEVAGTPTAVRLTIDVTRVDDPANQVRAPA